MKKENKGPARPKAPELTEPVSELTTNRLSVYLRCLNALDDAGVRTVSSQALAEQFHLNAAQIRKDLAYFGEFGVRGVGYYVKDLRQHLRQILGLGGHVRVAIMGAGNLGLALADYPGFRDDGFDIAFECAGVQDSIAAAVETLQKGGTLVLVAVYADQPRVNTGFIQDRELTVVGTLMYQYADFVRAVELIASGRVVTAPLETKHFTLERYADAYAFIDAARDRTMKVFIDV